MKHYAGLDVSVKETSVCIVDETGKVCREMKVASHPEDLVRVLAGSRLAARADRARSRAVVAMAVTAGWPRPGLPVDLHRDPPCEGVPEGAGEQDRPQRCARHRADDAGQPVPTGACEDADQPDSAAPC